MEDKQNKVIKTRKMKKQNKILKKKPQSGSKWKSTQYFDETRYRITSEVMTYPRLPKGPNTPTILEILREIEAIEASTGQFLDTGTYEDDEDTDVEMDAETAELGAVGPPVEDVDLMHQEITPDVEQSDVAQASYSASDENQVEDIAPCSCSSCNDTDAEKIDK